MDRDPYRPQKTFKIDKRHVNPSTGRSNPLDASNNSDNDGVKFPPIPRGALVETVPRRGDSGGYTPVDQRKAVMSSVVGITKKANRSKSCISPEPGAPLNPKPDGNFGLGLELAGKSLTLEPDGGGRCCDETTDGYDDCCDVGNAAVDDVTNVGLSHSPGYVKDFDPCRSTGSSQAENLSGTASDEFGRPDTTVVVEPGPADLDGYEEGGNDAAFNSGFVSGVNPVGSPAGCADVGLPDNSVVVDPGPLNLIGSDEAGEGIPETYLSRGVSSDFNYADPIGGAVEYTPGFQLQGENICKYEEFRMQAETSVQKMVDLDEEISSRQELLRTLDPHPPGSSFLPRPPSARKARPRKRPPVRCVKPTLTKLAGDNAPSALKIDKRASPVGGNAELEPSSSLCRPTSKTTSAILDSSVDIEFDYAAICPALRALSPQHSYLRPGRAMTPSCRSPESTISSVGPTPPPFKVHVTESGSHQALSEIQGDRCMGSADHYTSAHALGTISIKSAAPPKLGTHSAESGINRYEAQPTVSKQDKAERKRKHKEMKEKEAQRKEEEANAKKIARMKAEQEVANISTNRALFGRKDALPAIGKRTSEADFKVGELLKVKEVDLTSSPTVDASAAVDIIDRNDVRVRTTAFLKEISQDYINASHRILAKPEVTNQAPEIIEKYEDDIGRPYERYGGVQYSLQYETGNGNGHENISRSVSARKQASAKSRCSSAVKRCDA